MGMDWQPLIVAVAGVLIAITPVGVAYLTLQVRILGLRADQLERSATEDRATLRTSLAALSTTVRSTAADTQAVVKDVGGATK